MGRICKAPEDGREPRMRQTGESSLWKQACKPPGRKGLTLLQLNSVSGCFICSAVRGISPDLTVPPPRASHGDGRVQPA